jgi:hypothetical protein
MFTIAYDCARRLAFLPTTPARFASKEVRP